MTTNSGWRLFFVVGGAVLLAAAPAPGEDLTVVSSVSLGKNKVSTSTQYISSDKVRTGDGEYDTIMDYSTGRMVMIDHKKKEYHETSLEEMAAFLEDINKQLSGNPLGGLMGGKVEDVKVRKDSARKQIAGYECEHYVLTMGDGMRFDIWAAPALKAPHEYYDAAKARYVAMGPVGKKFEKMYAEMSKIQGFPLGQSIQAKVMMVKVESESEASEVRKGPIPASAFEVPAGYKQKKSPFKK